MAEATGQHARALLLIKTVHSAFFLLMTLSVLVLLGSAATGSIGVLTLIAAIALAAEGALLLLNRKRCPLTTFAERLGAESGRVTDIFLPGWLVPWVFELYAALTLLAIVGIAVRLAA